MVRGRLGRQLSLTLRLATASLTPTASSPSPKSFLPAHSYSRFWGSLREPDACVFAPSVDSHWLLSVNASRSRTGQRPLSVVEREGGFACLWIFRSAVVTLGVVSWPSGHERHPFATRGQGLCFRFWHFPVHGEVTAPGVFDLVQGGVGLGEQFGVGLAVTREQADADACRDDIILPEGRHGRARRRAACIWL